jgi:hypothetical protein
MYWVFNNEMLEAALAAFEARRQGEGASEQQARDETAIIKMFLTSAEAERAKMLPGRRY